MGRNNESCATVVLGGWSETQTITLGENQTPTQLTEQEIIGAAIAVAAISAGLGLFVYFKKRNTNRE